MFRRAAIGLGLAVLVGGIVPVTHTAHAASPFTLTVGAVSIAEGDSGSAMVQVPVDLSAPLAAGAVVTATYTVSSTSAVAGKDFVASSGVLKFKGAQVSKTIGVAILGDRFKESDKTVDVTLSNVSGADVLRDGIVTIIDDDATATPEPTVALGSTTVVEADAGKHYAYLPITLSDPVSEPVSVQVFYACGTTPADVIFGGAPTRTITFNPYQQVATLIFKLPANTAPSALAQFVEGIQLKVGNVNVVTYDGSVTLVDDDGTAPLPPYPVERVSVADNGSEITGADTLTCQVGGASLPAAVSPNGRYVLFFSDAFNAVAGDTNDAPDLFLHDRVADTTERINVADDGSELSLGSVSYNGFLSADANEATFETQSPEMLPTGASVAVFVRDRAAGTTTLASVLPDGTPAPGVSIASGLTRDGNHLAFLNAGQLYVRDLAAGTTVAVASSVPQVGWSRTPMAADGSQIAFVSSDSTLVPGDTNNYEDVFVRNLTTGATERINVSTSGVQETSPSGSSAWSKNDTQPTMSPDGRFVTFKSTSSTLARINTVFVRDRVAHTTEAASVGIPSTKPACYGNDGSVSDNGRYVVFIGQCMSWANKAGIVTIDKKSAGVWVRDRTLNTTARIDLSYTGKLPTPTGSAKPMVTGDGHFAVFGSAASNLVPADTNNAYDVFIRRIS